MADFPETTRTIPTPPNVNSDRPTLTPEETARLAQAVMRKQAALGVRGAIVFLVVIFGLPLVNWLSPNLANARVGGFTLSWLFLGILFYPITWVLSGWFVRASDTLERQIAQEYRARGSEEKRAGR